MGQEKDSNLVTINAAAYFGMEKRDVELETWYNKINKRSVANLGMEL